MEILLSRNDVEVNAVNDNGDTALHKASFIGREVINIKTVILNKIFIRFFKGSCYAVITTQC